MSGCGTSRTSGDVRLKSEKRSKSDIAQTPLTYRDLVRGPISAPPRVTRVTRATQRTLYCALAERIQRPRSAPAAHRFWCHLSTLTRQGSETMYILHAVLGAFYA